MKKLILVSFAILGFWLNGYAQNLWSWGYNEFGKLGLVDTTSKSTPELVNDESNWKEISAGSLSNLAIKKDGTLWAWGNNDYGQLGIGNNTIFKTPKQIGNSNDWIQVSIKNTHALGIKKDGTLWAWGNNDYGQLGIGNTTNNNSPQQVGTDSNWIFVETGAFNSFAIKKDGTLWSWGSNSYGQLGIGNGQNYHYPVKVQQDTDWLLVNAGLEHTTGIKNDGTLWAWGRNTWGQLGLSNTQSFNSPQKVGNNSNWNIISNGRNWSFAIKNDGTLWAWGRNLGGQFGNGNTSDYNYPVKIGNDTNWQFISTSINGNTNYHSAGIKKDGTLWTWGKNFWGQLGLGNNLAYYTPQQVGVGNNWTQVCIGSNQHTLALSKDKCISNTKIALSSLVANSCHGDKNAQIVIKSISGYSPFKIRWTHDTILKDSFASNLKAGFYKVVYTDKWDGCKDSLNINITDPQQILSTVDTVISPTCYNGTDGRAKISTQGGTGNLKVLWNDEKNQSKNEAINLKSSVYKVYIIDSFGCKDSLNVTVPESKNTPPEVIKEPNNIGQFSGEVCFTAKYKEQNNIFQWQTNQGTGWVNLSNAGQYEGVSTDSLIVSNITSNNNNQLFRCIVNNICGVDTTNEVRLSVWGVGSKDLHYNIKVFPNPVSANLYINGSKKFDYKIKTTTGQDILHGSTSNGVINMECILPGVYYLHVLDYNQLVLVKTIIKE